MYRSRQHNMSLARALIEGKCRWHAVSEQAVRHTVPTVWRAGDAGPYAGAISHFSLDPLHSVQSVDSDNC